MKNTKSDDDGQFAGIGLQAAGSCHLVTADKLELPHERGKPLRPAEAQHSGQTSAV